MKISFSTVLSILLCIVLIAGAVCLGAVRGWSDERDALLLGCAQRHNTTSADLYRSVEECRNDTADYDHRLSTQLTGRIAGLFGVEPIGSSLEGVHEQILRENAREEEQPGLQEQITLLLDEHVDMTLSLGKVILTIVLLLIIFGKRRGKGFPFGKLLAGFGLFKLWRRR